VRVSAAFSNRLCLAVLLAALSPAACVSMVKYDRCVSDAATSHAAAEAKGKGDAASIERLQGELAAAQATIQDRDSRVSELSIADHNTQAQLDEATAMNQQLRTELQRLGRDVDKMLTERGTLSKVLDDAKARLDELRKAQAAAEVRVALFGALANRFKPLVDAGQMRVETRRGQPVMEVSGDLLFEPGRSEIRAAGKGTLMEIAHALRSTASAGGRRFLVEFLVDSPEAKARASKSTWEITSGRSIAVVEFFVSLGMPAESLIPAAGGSFDPVAPGDSPLDRARNRRLDITLLPLEGEGVPPAP
jgi:chemotaxis protein MotB